jgi:LacI family transcriptional regulator
MSIVKVASHAGVSTATVSRVLNDFPGVGKETARQVRASLLALNYDPAKLKRGRKNGGTAAERPHKRTNSIAILTIGQTRDWLQLPVMAAAVAGISRGAKEYGFQVVLDEILEVAKPSDTVVNGKVDGAIVFLPSFVQPSSTQKIFASIGRYLPLVWVMGDDPGKSKIDHILPDNKAIGSIALNYLKESGCHDVAFVCMHPDWQLMRERGQAFAAAARDANIRSHSYLLRTNQDHEEMYDPGAIVEKDFADLIDRLVQARPRISGIFISNDFATVQVYPLLRRREIEPGRDIVIVSCDNEDVRLSGLHPRPASIDVGAEEAGWRAVHRLASRLENTQEPPVLISVAPRLILPGQSVSAGT